MSPMRDRPAAVGRSSALAWLALAAVSAACFAWFASIQVAHGDLTAYWAAGRLGLQRGDPYLGNLFVDGEPFRHSPFLYPPLSVPLFVPISLLPYHEARIAWLGFEIAAVLCALRMAGLSWRASAWATAGVVAVMRFLFHPLWAHLVRGQAELYILLFVAASWRLWRQDRPLFAGIALAAAAAIKPPIALLFVVPALERRFRFLLGGVAGGAGLLALSLLCVPSQVQFAYWRDYAPRVASALDAGATLIHPDHHATGGPKRTASRYGGRPVWAAAGSLTHYVRRWDPAHTKAMNALSTLALLVTAVVLYLRGKSWPEGESRRAWRWGVVMLAVPAWQPMAWAMAHVTVLFVIALAACQPSAFPMTRWTRILALVGLAYLGMGDPIAMGIAASTVGVDANGTWTLFFLRAHVAVGALFLWGLALTRRSPLATGYERP